MIGGVNRIHVRTLLLAFLAISTTRAFDDPSSLDPAFLRIPFTQWLTETGQPFVRWTVAVSHPELTFHQRLSANIEFKVDGKDLAPRRGKGQLVFFSQITGTDGTKYQNHGAIDLAKLDEDIRLAYLTYEQSAFVLPGDYQLAVAILDTASREHTAKQMAFHVANSKKEFAPGIWKDLKPVEMIPAQDAPDSWYLPNMTGRLHWGAPVRTPVRMEVILNYAAPKGAGLNTFLPTLRALAPSWQDGVEANFKVLDVHGRRLLYRQNKVRELDWPALRDSLSGQNTATVDVKALGERHRDAQFFVNEVGRSLRSMEQAPCLLLVLSNPISFEDGEDLSSISTEGKSACEVIYIRAHSPRVNRPIYPEPGLRGGRRGRFGGGGPMGPVRGVNPRGPEFDQLANTLKSLNPKIFDVTTPDEMSKIFADIYRTLFAR
jgi:hypothetical protein